MFTARYDIGLQIGTDTVSSLKGSVRFISSGQEIRVQRSHEIIQMCSLFLT